MTSERMHQLFDQTLLGQYEDEGVIAGMTIIGKSQEHNNIDSALLERCHSREHRLCVAALVQIGNQEQVSF